MPVASFGRGRRLLNSADYSRVFDAADHKVSHKYYLILARKKPEGQARLGLVVSKKNIRLATARNRAKRVVRETFRTHAESLNSLDIVFLARKGFDTLPPVDQTRLLREAWIKLAKYMGKRR